MNSSRRFTTVTEEEIRQTNEEAILLQTQNQPVWLILKQLSPSVLVPYDLDILKLTGSVNINN